MPKGGRVVTKWTGVPNANHPPQTATTPKKAMKAMKKATPKKAMKMAVVAPAAKKAAMKAAMKAMKAKKQ